MSAFLQGKPPNRAPETKNEWGIVIILSFFFLLFIVADLVQDFSLVKLSAPFFLISWIPLLIIHELGHALMARMLGWRVELISIGIGKVRSRKTFLGMPIEFRTIPIAGFVQPRPTDLILPRLKQFLIYSAGPGIELLCVLLLVAAIGYGDMTTRTNDVAIIAAQSFCVAALFGVIINLFPITHDTDRGTSWSDGLGMILCWRIPDEHFAERIQAN